MDRIIDFYKLYTEGVSPYSNLSKQERTILKSTFEFAKNNDIHFDEMTAGMIINTIREVNKDEKI